jgi:hypothetical protein
MTDKEAAEVFRARVLSSYGTSIVLRRHTEASMSIAAHRSFMNGSSRPSLNLQLGSLVDWHLGVRRQSCQW